MMPEMPTMEVQEWLWMLILFAFGAFFLALAGALSKYMQDKWFKIRKPNPNGNGGMTHAQAEAMITALNDNGDKLAKGLGAVVKSQEEVSKVVLATDEDGVHKVHNKPSVERIIRKIYSKLTGGATDG